MTNATNSILPSTKIHKWQRAGLGLAPFTYNGVTESKFKVPGTDVSKPGASCDYCATAIVDCYWFVSADGRKFKVGCECVRKHGDLVEVNAIRLDANRIRRERAEAALLERVARIQELAPVAGPYLETKPHPNAHMAKRGATLADYVDFLLTRAGSTGKRDACQIVEANMIEIARAHAGGAS